MITNDFFKLAESECYICHKKIQYNKPSFPLYYQSRESKDIRPFNTICSECHKKAGSPEKVIIVI